MLYFILLLHVLCPDLVLSLTNVRSCGSLRMIFGTRPHSRRPRLCSFVTSTPNLLPSTTTRSSVRRLSHRSTEGLVVDSAPRTVSLISSRLIPSPSRSSTTSLRLPLCGMRALPPILTSLSSPHNIGSPNRYSSTGSPSGTSNLCLRSRVALNS
jgi:hypothetical protein